MKIGRVCFNIEYVVDLDNSEMIDAAKELICQLPTPKGVGLPFHLSPT